MKRILLAAITYFALGTTSLYAQAPNLKFQTPLSYPVGSRISPISATNTGGPVPGVYYGQASTIIVNSFNTAAVAADSLGNIYLVDNTFNGIRKINSKGISIQFAGNGNTGAINGQGTAASFNNPTGLALDPAGNLYVADTYNNMIRKITPEGVVSTLAGKLAPGSVNGTGSAASFNNPQGIAADASGNVYISDTENHMIRKISSAGVVTTLAGSINAGAANGKGTSASFNSPKGIVVDSQGNVFVSDNGNHQIRKITKDGTVTTFAGNASAGFTNGTGSAASFNGPTGLTMDKAGNLYVGDAQNYAIRKITTAAVVSTLAGGQGSTSIDGTGIDAGFSSLRMLAIDAGGNLLLTDNLGLRKVTLSGYQLSPALPPGLEFDERSGTISGIPLIATAAKTYSITGINSAGSSTASLSIATTGNLSPTVLNIKAPTLSITSSQAYTTGKSIVPLLPVNTGGIIPGTYYGQVSSITLDGMSPNGMVFDKLGNKYVTDGNRYQIKKISPDGTSSVYAGSGRTGAADGPAMEASFNNPQGLAIDSAGNLYVADQDNNKIRVISVSGKVSTLAGNGLSGHADGRGEAASFSAPAYIAADRFGNLYVTDASNHLVRKITASGLVSTLAGNETAGLQDGTGKGAAFSSPSGIAVDALGNVYIGDSGNHAIRKITPLGVVTTLAGNGTAGATNGTGAAASFNSPAAICLDDAGNVYVNDRGNYLLRKVTPAGLVSSLAGSGVSNSIDGIGNGASFNALKYVTYDKNGNLYGLEYSKLRKITTGGYEVKPALPAGLELSEVTGAINGLPLTAAASKAYTISGYNAAGSSSATVTINVTGILSAKVSAVKPPVLSVAGPQSYTTGTAITPLTPTNTGGAVPVAFYGHARTINIAETYVNGTAADKAGNIYFSDNYAHVIKKISSDGTVSVFAGRTNVSGALNGPATASTFSNPQGLAIDSTGNLYVADEGNNLIRKISPSGVVSTLAGNGTAGYNSGKGATASFTNPRILAADRFGNIYVLERYSSTIRRISTSGLVSTFADYGNPYLEGLVLDASCNVYITDVSDHTIKKISQTGVITTFAGSGASGASDGTGTAASFYSPGALTIDDYNNIYVADIQNHLIRKISPAGLVSTVAGSGSVSPADGPGLTAGFGSIQFMAFDGKGNLVLSDNSYLRKVSLFGFDIRPMLPAGLEMSEAGVISGNPLAAVAAKNYVISAYNDGGNGSATLNLKVTGTLAVPAVVAAPVISYAGPKTYPAGTAITPLLPANSGGAIPAVPYGQISNLAGSGLPGRNNGRGTDASFNTPLVITSDFLGNVYVADQSGYTIRKITPSGLVTTLAGSGQPGAEDGTGIMATFNNITGLAADNSGNLYVSEANNHMIRKVTPAGVVSTFAGNGNAGSDNGTGKAATFNTPMGIAIDASNNLYVADKYNFKIRKITPSGAVTTFAGNGNYGSDNGSAMNASFSGPTGIAIDGAKNLYVTEQDVYLIRKITSGGTVSTFAGGDIGSADGQGTAASFNQPRGISTDKSGNIYVADYGNHLIRKLSPTGAVTTLAGTTFEILVNGLPTVASFSNPADVTVDPNGNLYLADANSHLIRKINLNGYTIEGALPPGLSFNNTTGGISGKPTAPFTAATYKITGYNGGGSSTASLSLTVTGTAAAPAPLATAPKLAYAGPKSYVAGTVISALAPVNSGGAIPAKIYGQTTTVLNTNNSANGVAIDAAGNLYTSDASSHVIRKTSPSGITSIFAGGTYGFSDGKGSAAKFSGPEGIALDAAGNLYVADRNNQRIRKITPTGTVTTLAGNDNPGAANGTGAAASFSSPEGLCLDAAGNVYVADAGNHLIRKITPAGKVTTLAGSGSAGADDGAGLAASFNNPTALAIDAAGNILVADKYNYKIRKVSPTGVVSTIAGNGTSGTDDGAALTAGFSGPTGITIDAAGTIFLADVSTVRKITPTTVITLAGKYNDYSSGDGTGPQAGLSNTHGITLDAEGTVYLATNNLVRKINTTGYLLNTPLPGGLEFDATTGAISGIPLMASTAKVYSVTGYNAGGSSTATVSITVTGSIPVKPPVVAAPKITYPVTASLSAGAKINTISPVNTGGTIPMAIYGKTSVFLENTGYFYPIVMDAAGNIYTADNTTIYKISPEKVISVFAGNGTGGYKDGTGTAASFNYPRGLALDPSGNLYVADQSNQRIRKISPAGIVTTLAGSGNIGRNDGPGALASFNYPEGIVADSFGNVYVADTRNNLIRKISPSGLVSTLAGNTNGGYENGNGTSASFNSPNALVVDAAGNLYVSDYSNHAIRKISPSGAVSTFAGNGSPGEADGSGEISSLNSIIGIAIDAGGNIYAANNYTVRKITPSGAVSALAGKNDYTYTNFDGTGSSARFSSIQGITADGSGNLVLNSNYSLRKISAVGYVLNTPLPPGLDFDASTGSISGIPEVAAAAKTYSVTAYNLGGSSTATFSLTVTGTIAVVPPAIKAPAISYTASVSFAAGTAITPMSPVNAGGAVPARVYGQTSTLQKELNSPRGIARSANGSIAITGPNEIIQITPQGVFTVIAGNGSYGFKNGTGTGASFNNLYGAALDATGNLYVADKDNHVIRKISPTGEVSTFAGSGNIGRADGPGASASFNRPQGVFVDNYGNLYIADTDNNLIRKISPSGLVSTIAGAEAGFEDGTLSNAKFNAPTAIVMDAARNLYIADRSNNRIRKITPAGAVSTLAGSGEGGSADGSASSASFTSMNGMTLDPAGNLYIADNNLIRRVTPAGVVSTLAGNSDYYYHYYITPDGTGSEAGFSTLQGLATDTDGNVYATEAANLRKVSAVGYTLSPALPAGLSFDATTGTISGIPLLAAAVKNYTVTAYNMGGSSSFTFKLAVTGAAVPPAAPEKPVIAYKSPQTYAVGRAIDLLPPLSTGGAIPPAVYGQSTAYAGSGTDGRNNGNGTSATFTNIQALTTDVYGNTYIADQGNYLVRKIDPAGYVSKIAGNGIPGIDNGSSTVASFYNLGGIAVDNSNNLFLTESSHHLIRKISPAGVVSTFAGSGEYGSANGTTLAASFAYPKAIAADKSNNLYVLDRSTYLIRKITPAGVVSTLAGSGSQGSADGKGALASFQDLNDLTVDPASGNIYVADGTKIRKVTPTGVVTTLAGSDSYGFADGPGASATFGNLAAIATDLAGNVYVSDKSNHLVRKVSPAGLVTTLVGNGSNVNGEEAGTLAGINSPSYLTTDRSGNLFVVTGTGNTIRKISLSGYAISPQLSSGLVFENKSGKLTGLPDRPADLTNYLVTGYNSAGQDTANLKITVVYPPVALATPGFTTFASMGDIDPVAVRVDSSLLVSDLSKSTLASATATLSSGYVSSQDKLAITGTASTGNITGSFDAVTGKLSLSSAGAVATLAQWRSALRSITYINSNNVNPDTTNRVVTFVLNDGLISSNPATRTVKIKYTPSANANLKSLALSTATIAPGFDPGTFVYTTRVSNDVASLTLTPVSQSLNAKIKINGVDVKTGQASAALALNAGKNEIKTVVTAQDGITVKTYTVNATRGQKQTITFASLNEVSYGAPDFAPGASSSNKTIPVTYTSSNTAVASITSSGLIHVVKAGTVTITAAQAGDSTYDAAVSVSKTLTINPAKLTITAQNKSKTYGSVNPALTVSISGFVNGETAAIVTKAPTLSTFASLNSDAGTYPITASGAVVSSNYAVNYVAGTLLVNPAVLTITANDQSKFYGEENPALTLKYEGFLNSDAQVNLSTLPVAATKATVSSPVGTYQITVGGGVAKNYTFKYIGGTLNIKAVPVTFAAIPAKTYGTPDFDPGAVSSLPITYTSSNTQVATIVSGKIKIVGTGTTTIQANSGSASVSQTLTVTPAVLTVTAANLTKVYGSINPALSLAYAGFVNGDTKASLTEPVLSTTAVKGSPAGSYPITLSGGSSTKYTLTLVPGTLTVTKAELTITAANKTKAFGTANPALTANYSGFVNGDTTTVLTTLPTLATTATTSSAAGSYPITVSGAAAANYTFKYVPGTLTVTSTPITFAVIPSQVYGTPDFAPGASSTATITYTSSNPAVATIVSGKIHIVGVGTTTIKAANSSTSVSQTLTVTPKLLTVTATSLSKVYGAANPILSLTYSGFVNSDTKDSLTEPVLSTTAVKGSPAGTYPITLSGGVSTKYTFSFVAGSLTVTKAELTITALNKSKEFGSANPALTARYTGFVNGDTTTVLTTLPVLATTATTSSIVGSYPITASGAVAANYTFKYVPGTLTVTSVPVTFAAIPSKVYGTADFAPGASSTAALTYSSSNLAVATIVSGKIHITGVGTVTVTAANGSTSVTQTLTVTPAVLTVTAANLTKVYGSANPPLSLAYSGFVNGDTKASLTEPVLSTTAVKGSPAGTYPITMSGGASTKYTLTLVSGLLTITKAELTITAANKTKIAGSANPALTANYNGFVNGDTTTVLTTLPMLATTATTSSAAGSYPITASGAVAVNYTFKYVPGTLTVTSTPVTFAAIPAKTYGTPDFDPGAISAFTITYTSSNLAVATIISGKIHIIGVGTTTITAANSSTNASQTLTVTPAVLTVTAANLTKVYGSVNPALSLAYAGFVNGDTKTSLTEPLLSTTAVKGSPAGSYPITLSGGTSSKYTLTLVSGTLTVSKAVLTITAANKTKAFGAANPTLSASYSGFVNGDTTTVLTTLPSLATTATTSSLAGTYPITASGAVAANYTFKYVPGTLTVTSASITFAAIPSKVYGTADFAPGAISTAALGYSSSNPAVATIVSGKIHITGVGTTVIKAVANTVNASQTLTVTPATLTVTANNLSKVYGSFNPMLTFTYTGFVYNDNTDSLKAPFVLVTTAERTSAAGNYPITVSSGYLNNYNIVYVPGILTVNKAELTVTAGNKTKNAGTANPELTATYSGFVNGDGVEVITTLPTLSTTATTSSGPGAYPVTATGAAAANYTFVYEPGVLNVLENPTPPVISYASQTFTKNLLITPLRPTNTGGEIPAATYGMVTTYAGGGPSRQVDGPDSVANFYSPIGLASDIYGNIYVADRGNHIIRKITPNKMVSTIAGTGAAGAANGAANEATFNSPSGVAADAAGNIYVADSQNDMIRKITASGKVSTFASFGKAYPVDVALDHAGNLFVSLQDASTILKYTPAGVKSTFVSGINTPFGLAVDAADNLYFTSWKNEKIYKVSPAGTVSVLAGNGGVGSLDGPGNVATFTNPQGIKVAADGNIYVADDALIRKITPAGVVSTLAGSGSNSSVNGIGTAAGFNGLAGMALDNQDNLIVAEYNGNLVRKISINGYSMSPALPAGLSLESATGIISGKPTAAMPTTAFTVSAGNKYGSSSSTFNLTVKDQTTLTFAAIPAKVYGTADFAPGAISTESITYTSSNLAVATIVSGKIHIVGVGTTTIKAANSATNVSQTLTVTAAPLTITAVNKSKSFGAANPALTATYSGFVNSETNTVLTAQPVLSTTATTASAVGSYPIVVSGATAKNYAITHVNGKLTVNSVTMTFAAIPAKTYGAADFAPGAISTAAVTYTSSDLSVATIVSGNIHITGAGTTTITANNGSQTLSQVVTVSKASQAITFNDLPAVLLGTAAVDAGATASSALPVTLVSADTTIAMIVNGKIKPVGTGTAIITAMQNGNANYLAAGPISKELAVTLNAEQANIKWAWMSGDNTGPTTTVLGTAGVESASNKPGGRREAANWTDASGNFWLYGGTGVSTSYNDLWKYNPVTGMWTWMNANRASNPSFGTKGTASSANQPGSRNATANWADKSGNLWFYGGSTPSGWAGDFWKYNIATGMWTWMSGDSERYLSGVYGTKGVASSANNPGARYNASSWTDAAGNFWMFGGYGFKTDRSYGPMNDLWKYSPGTNQWTWMGGDQGFFKNGVYGTKGSAATGNMPGSRQSATSWADANGNLWLFGGAGNDGAGNSGNLNDLWKYSIASGQWTWVSGSSTAAKNGTYGSVGVESAGNVPGSRQATSGGWITSSGELCFFGGYGLASSGTTPSYLNDLWKFNPASGNWTWVSGDPIARQTGKYGTKGVPDTKNKPGARYGHDIWTDASGGVWFFGGTGYPASGDFTHLSDLWKLQDLNNTGIQAKKIGVIKDQENVKNLDQRNAEPTVKQAVSINGDGKNDVLIIDGIDQYPENKLVIVSKAGYKVYEVSGYNNTSKAFDGHSNINGALQQPGTYFYLLEYKTKEGMQRKTGYFVLKN